MGSYYHNYTIDFNMTTIKYYNKTIEELLAPRWKVIADFPGNDQNIGESLKRINSDERANISVFKGMYEINPDNYPAIFKKLKWWEEREFEDIPQYLKLISTGKICKVERKGDITGTVFVGKMFQGGEVHTHLDFYLPSTKEEYDNYQTSNRKVTNNS